MDWWVSLTWPGPRNAQPVVDQPEPSLLTRFDKYLSNHLYAGPLDNYIDPTFREILSFF